MKVLLVHNYYRSAAPSGENIAVDTDFRLLGEAGIDVSLLAVSNDELTGVSVFRLAMAAGLSAWNAQALRKVRTRLKELRPDVVHIHNTFPQLSASVFSGSLGTTVATVATVHNYRFFCSKGIPLRNGHPCTSCWQSSLAALRHRCYRDSLIATIPAALFVEGSRRFGILSKNVDKVVALTEFQAEILKKFGVPAERLAVRANPILLRSPALSIRHRGDRALFVGRLSDEKGVKDLLSAFSLLGPRAPNIDIVGEGPNRAQCEEMVKTLRLQEKVTFLGQRSIEEVHNLMSRARVMIAPFKSWEGLPTVLIEAAGLGVPAICPAFGAAGSVVEHGRSGLHFQLGRIDQLAESIRTVYSNNELHETLCAGAMRRYQERYAQSAAMNALMQVYESAIEARRHRV